MLRLCVCAMINTQALMAPPYNIKSSAMALNIFSLLASYRKQKAIAETNGVYGLLAIAYYLKETSRRGDTAGIISGSAQLSVILVNQYAQALSGQTQAPKRHCCKRLRTRSSGTQRRNQMG